MKKFMGNFMGEDVFLDDEEDGGAIALIEHLQPDLDSRKNDAVDASMYRIEFPQSNKD